MEAIVIHPDSQEQLKAVKLALKSLNVRYETQSQLPLHVIASVQKGLDEYTRGEFVSEEAFREKHGIGKWPMK